MDISNASLGGNFVLLGFSNQPQLDPIISTTILLFHIMTLLNNTAIILLTFLDSQFHTPMYFFLSKLTFLDISYTTSIVPQMLINLWGPNKLVTYAGCILQFFFTFDFSATESLLLVVMAYDCYAAVCQPLDHLVIMHPHFCKKMAAASWLTACVVP